MQEILDKLHGALLLLLREFHRICVENDLLYTVTGGTCLGAVRHQGFIPWDDDADVCMPRKAYDEFVALCLNGKLSQGFTLQVRGEKEPNYFDSFVRLRLDHTLCVIPYHEESGWNHLGVFMDIFPYDETNLSDIKKIGQRKKKYLFARRLLVNKLCKRRPSLQSKLLHIVLLPFSLSFLEKKEANAIRTLKGGATTAGYEAYVDLNSPYSLDRAVFPLKLFDDRKLVKFESIEVFVPKQYDAFLTIMFGDYMKLPPEEARVAHLPSRIEIN